jgi:hypothetical protein
MAVTSPGWGIVTPSSTDNDQVPADLARLAAFIDLIGAVRYPSQAARTAGVAQALTNLGLAAIPRGAQSWVDSDGYPTYYDGTVWRPNSGQVLGVYRLTPPGGQTLTDSQIIGFNNGQTLTAYPFTTVAVVTYNCYVSQSDANQRSDARLMVNSGVYSAAIIVGTGSGSGGEHLQIAAGASTQLQGILAKVSGGGNSTLNTDGSITWMSILHLAR